VDVVGIEGGSLLVLMIEPPPIQFILIAGLLYSHILIVSAPSTVATGHKDATTP